MKFIEKETISLLNLPVVELTRRNLESLLAKLDDPNSRRTLIDPDDQIAVRAVENEEHYKDRAPGLTLINGELT